MFVIVHTVFGDFAIAAARFQPLVHALRVAGLLIEYP
jgi:hypothetical protein